MAVSADVPLMQREDAHCDLLQLVIASKQWEAARDECIVCGLEYSYYDPYPHEDAVTAENKRLFEESM